MIPSALTIRQASPLQQEKPNIIKDKNKNEKEFQNRWHRSGSHPAAYVCASLCL
jgi:hypothetical protein